ncbi:MAG: hypothetical protein U5L11_12315 [Arhodomonas sp.]|nr:hypothetical protein [Arhodomonas sp.]
MAEVQNGVWTGQEPDFDSPFNLGGHCAKGASVRRARHGRETAEVSDEARRRALAARRLGSGGGGNRR